MDVSVNIRRDCGLRYAAFSLDGLMEYAPAVAPNVPVAQRVCVTQRPITNADFIIGWKTPLHVLRRNEENTCFLSWCKVCVEDDWHLRRLFRPHERAAQPRMRGDAIPFVGQWVGHYLFCYMESQ